MYEGTDKGDVAKKIGSETPTEIYRYHSKKNIMAH